MIKSSTWYHGSPVEFDKFELHRRTNSRLGTGGSVYLTSAFNLASAFSKRMGSKDSTGFVYEVEIPDDHTGRLHNMQMLTDDLQPDEGYECVEIFKMSELKIVKRHDIK